MRPGSGVQMMGLRVGQVEEIIPVVEDESSYVKMRFVITNPDIKIPKAGMPGHRTDVLRPLFLIG